MSLPQSTPEFMPTVGMPTMDNWTTSLESLFEEYPTQPFISLNDFMLFDAASSAQETMPLSPMPMFDAIPMLQTPSSMSTISNAPPTPLIDSASNKRRRELALNRDELLEEVELKRKRNTESARRSRERKLQKLGELQAQLADSEQKRKLLMEQVARLQAENASLRQRL